MANEVELIGYVRAFSQREKANIHNPQIKDHIWSFRLEQFDSSGDPITPQIAVQMLGSYFDGNLREGDQVIVRGSFDSGRNLRATAVTNVNTNSTVSGNTSYKTRNIVVGVGIIAFIIFLIYLFTSAGKQNAAFEQQQQQMNISGAEIQQKQQETEQAIKAGNARLEKEQRESDRERKKHNH